MLTKVPLSLVLTALKNLTTTVRTASYTIPVNRVAYVYVECHSGGVFTINGTNAVETAAFLNVDTTGSSSVSYTVPTNYRAAVTTFCSDTGRLTRVNGNGGFAYSPNTYSPIIEVGPAGTISIDAGNLGTYAIQGYAVPSQATHKEAAFILPAGAVLNGSGNWRATVMEYDAE